MSEFTPLREAVDTLASRAPSPDFGELKRRAARRGRRRVALVAAATAAVIAGSVQVITGHDVDRRSILSRSPSAAGQRSRSSPTGTSTPSTSMNPGPS